MKDFLVNLRVSQFLNYHLVLCQRGFHHKVLFHFDFFLEKTEESTSHQTITATKSIFSTEMKREMGYLTVIKTFVTQLNFSSVLYRS